MLRIEDKQKKIIQQEAAAVFPDECCGFLLGYEENNIRRITRAEPVNNSREGDRRRRFEISPKDYMQAEKLAAQEGLELLGIYHSHPQHPAIPSETDRLAAQPFFSYLIVSVYDGHPRDFRSWLLNEQHRFEEENIISND